MDDFPAEGRSACFGCGREYDSSGKCPCGYDEDVRRWENRPGRAKRAALASRDWPDEAGKPEPCEDSEAENLPAIRPENLDLIRPKDLDGFHRQLRQVLEYELPRWHPLDPASTWKRRQPKDEKEVTLAALEVAESEVARWREALGSPEDLLKRLLKPLVWLGARILERAAPRDRPRVAQEFVRYAVPPTATGDTFLEQELAKLNPSNFSRRWRNDLKQLLPLFPLLFRDGQEQLKQQLTEKLEAEIRKMFLRSPSLSRSPVTRRVKAALLSDQPAEEIQGLLREVGWSEAEWARAAVLHPSTISHLIHGKNLRVVTFNQLIEALEKKLARKKVNN